MQQMTVLGAKRSVGVLDNGRRYDSTKVYVQTKMRDGDDQVGYSVAEYPWGDSSNFDKIAKQSFPFLADVDMDVVSNGKNSQIVIFDVVPVKATKP